MSVSLFEAIVPQYLRMAQRQGGEYSFTLASMLARSAALAGEGVLRASPARTAPISADRLNNEALALVRRSRSVVRTAQKELKSHDSSKLEISAGDAFARFDLDVKVSPEMLSLVQKQLSEIGEVHASEGSYVSYPRVRKKLKAKDIDLETTAAMVNTAKRALGFDQIVGSYYE